MMVSGCCWHPVAPPSPPAPQGRLAQGPAQCSAPAPAAPTWRALHPLRLAPAAARPAERGGTLACAGDHHGPGHARVHLGPAAGRLCAHSQVSGCRLAGCTCVGLVGVVCVFGGWGRYVWGVGAGVCVCVWWGYGGGGWGCSRSLVGAGGARRPGALGPLCSGGLATSPAAAAAAAASRRSIQIPKRGQIYSVNDARYHDWPKGLQQVHGGGRCARYAAPAAHGRAHERTPPSPALPCPPPALPPPHLHPSRTAPPTPISPSPPPARPLRCPTLQYIDTIRQGKGQYPKQYSARYICSLVADFHRTLLYGGVAMNPRSHLRLVYEGNPMSFLCEQVGCGRNAPPAGRLAAWCRRQGRACCGGSWWGQPANAASGT
jgi:hypothetical protein